MSASRLGLGLLLLADLGWTLVSFPRYTRDRRRTVGSLPTTDGPALILAATLLDGELPPVLVSRLETGLQLYQAGRVRGLLVSGHDDEPGAMRRWLEARGVPAAAIVEDCASWRTIDSVRRAADDLGLRQVVVVTSDFHLARALWLAEHVGLDALGVPSPTAIFPLEHRLREYVARHVALWDVWRTPRITRAGAAG